MRTIGSLIVRARPGYASARLVSAKRVRGLTCGEEEGAVVSTCMQGVLVCLRYRRRPYR